VLDFGENVARNEDRLAFTAKTAEQMSDFLDAGRIEPVGRSSRIKTFGSFRTAAAIARRWRMPSE
jgi:hypothetical protein